MKKVIKQAEVKEEKKPQITGSLLDDFYDEEIAHLI